MRYLISFMKFRPIKKSILSPKRPALYMPTPVIDMLCKTAVIVDV
jgi:hypothetical protein